MPYRCVAYWIVAFAPVVVGGCGCQSPPASETTRPGAPPATETLSELLNGIASGSITVVELTQPLGERTPVITLPPPFANTPGFSRTVLSNFDPKGPAWYWNAISLGEHVGTHFDAPCHWITGRDRSCVDGLEPKQFIGPAAVIDAVPEVERNPNFVLSREAILRWEEQHGRIPPRAWVILRTGWGRWASDPQRYFNTGPDGMPHYPGFGKESAEFLTRERDILGVGTEAVGTDAAVGAQTDPPFPNHAIMHGAGKFGLTQLVNVDQLPPTGAVIIATPLKIERGSGSPVRAIALKPAQP